MALRKIHTLGVVAALVIAIASTASASWYRQSGNTGLSVFAAYEKESEKTGFGLALTTRNQGLNSLSAVALGKTVVLQSSQLRPIGLGMLPVYAGMTAAYSFEINGGDELDAVPAGFMSGLEVVLARTQPKAGFSLDLRASSLSKGVNPIKWISDPDVLWIGAGASYNF